MARQKQVVHSWEEAPMLIRLTHHDWRARFTGMNAPPVAALFVATDGAYFGLAGVDPWDEIRDARLYEGPFAVVAHPPCERWGRYWGGGPMLHGTPRQKTMGDDGGCFASALASVRKYGGILEHPEASHAWVAHGLVKPTWGGGWISAGDGVGMTCCVAQGNYVLAQFDVVSCLRLAERHYRNVHERDILPGGDF